MEKIKENKIAIIVVVGLLICIGILAFRMGQINKELKKNIELTVQIGNATQQVITFLQEATKPK